MFFPSMRAKDHSNAPKQDAIRRSLWRLDPFFFLFNICFPLGHLGLSCILYLCVFVSHKPACIILYTHTLFTELVYFIYLFISVFLHTTVLRFCYLWHVPQMVHLHPGYCTDGLSIWQQNCCLDVKAVLGFQEGWLKRAAFVTHLWFLSTHFHSHRKVWNAMEWPTTQRRRK